MKTRFYPVSVVKYFRPHRGNTLLLLEGSDRRDTTIGRRQRYRL